MKGTFPHISSCFTKGILRNISIIADRKKHIIQIHNTGINPYVLYKIPPKTGPIKAENELIILIIEFAAINWSGFTNTGTLACTEGW